MSTKTPQCMSYNGYVALKLNEVHEEPETNELLWPQINLEWQITFTRIPERYSWVDKTHSWNTAKRKITPKMDGLKA